MYAVKGDSYRAIAKESDLQPGEVLELTLSESTLKIARGVEMLQRRDHLLRMSDWAVSQDSPLTPLERELWKVYRTKLSIMHDLPGFPDLQWPCPPPTSAR